ncbi:MAG: NADPH:quinone reductase, partial [Gemmataceae bacterium]
MKAAFFVEPGTPEVLTYSELPTPDPAPGYVRVRVEAASVNPIDTYIRAGLVQMPRARPTILGCDFAGRIDALGEGVQGWAVGDRVWGSNQGLQGRPGTTAEFVCPAVEWLHPLADRVDPKVAAAAALVGITAHLGLFFRAPLQPGETLFVNGATGGVGSCVVQMAKAIGARVIATIGREENRQIAEQIGADVVVNYKAADATEQIRAAAPQGINFWYETVPPTDLDRTIDLMAPRGRIVVMAGRGARPVLPNGAFYVKGLQLLGFAMFNFTAAEQRPAGVHISQML